ncbi:MAG: M24 family metallopeptidase [Spirochaetaceae bacterium]
MDPKLFDIGELQERLFDELNKLVIPNKNILFLSDFVDDFFEKNSIFVIPETIPLTININNIVYHGQPTDYILLSGDIISIDICFCWEGVKIDGAKTFIVGEGSLKYKNLISTNKEALKQVLKIIDVGTSVKDILLFLNEYIGLRGYYLFPDGLGHGIGKGLHESPILSLSNLTDFKYKFKKEDFFTIEPIIFLFKDEVYQNSIGEGVISESNVSSQFEISIYIKEQGEVEILNIGLLN